MIDRPLEGSGGNPKIVLKNPKSVAKSQNPENLKIEIWLILNRKRVLLPLVQAKKPCASQIHDTSASSVALSACPWRTAPGTRNVTG